MTKEERRALNSSRYKVYEQYRVLHGFSDYHISKELGIPSSTLSDWKYGLSCPKADTLYRICEYLGMPLERVINV